MVRIRNRSGERTLIVNSLEPTIDIRRDDLHPYNMCIHDSSTDESQSAAA